MCGRYLIGNTIAYPGDELLVLTRGKKEMMKWGYQTDFAKIINTRAETVFEKPIYKESLKNYRCLVPMDGFFEWQKKTKVPYLIRAANKQPLLAAGIYEPSGTYSIITREATKDMELIHSRMPYLLDNKNVQLWLDDPRVILGENYVKNLICTQTETKFR